MPRKMCIKTWIKITRNGEEQRGAEMKSDKLTQTLKGSTAREGKSLSGLLKQRKRANEFWSIQVDASATDEEGMKVDGGSGARAAVGQ